MLRVFCALCVVVVALCGVAPAFASDSAVEKTAGAPSDAVSEPATSLVVFDYPVDPHSATRSRYPVVFLSSAASAKNQLVLGRETGLQVLEVPAGSYYIRQVTSDHYGFPSAPRPVPENAEQLLKIPPGVVAYLGNVRWTTDMGLRMNFSKEGLLDLQKKTELHEHPLFLVAFGNPPQPVSWD